MAQVLQTPYVGRLAPSPTGALHLGNVRTFMIAWLRARQAGGKLILRIEDLDHPKDKPGADKEAIEDLKWLGFDWDEEYWQSKRLDKYKAALEKLIAKDLVYPCVCSRKDVEAAQSAPHEGEQLYYPGTCRGKYASWEEAYKVMNSHVEVERWRTPCWRFKAPKDFPLGDFPICRDRWGAGYTLAVVVDDADMGVTEVVRGDDLVPATPCQNLLQDALGLPRPEYLHVPLVVGPDGKRLAKRHGDTRISSYRAAGVKPEVIINRLAGTLKMSGGTLKALLNQRMEIPHEKTYLE